MFFAQSSFKWSNLAAKNAGVTCVVVGIRPTQSGQKFIFSEDNKRKV
ncbi:DNA methyltransferase [Peribacillus frigoritolerans]